MKMRILTALFAGIISVMLLVSCQTAVVPAMSAKDTEPVKTAVQAEKTPAPSDSPSVTDDSSLAYFVNQESPQKPEYDSTGRPRYDISVTYNEKEHSAKAVETVEYTNNTAGDLNELYMHIYPNHFSKKEYVEMSSVFGGEQGAYPNKRFNPGYIKFSGIKAADVPVEFQVQGDDLTILKIPLAQPLQKGESIRLDLEFEIQLPERIGRFAWSETAASFANWYPIMAVYDEDGWNLDPYYEIGDPFYSETADYTVTIDMPEGFEAAFTGDIISDKCENGRRVLALSETGVRDFAFVLSRDFVIKTQSVDGVEIRAAVPEDKQNTADDVLAYAVKAISLYNKLFGMYTNDTFSVVFSDLGSYSGMEYPGLVILDAGILDEDLNTGALEQIEVHEIAHQWWYSAVGNDEIDEGWLDESLTCFSTEVYFSADERDITFPMMEPFNSTKLGQSLPEFGDWDRYAYVYTFGPSFYKTMMAYMGKESFYTMLQNYYSEYIYGIATAEDLRNLIKTYGNDTALKWFDQCVYGEPDKST